MLIATLCTPPIRNDQSGSGEFKASRAGRLHYGKDYYACPSSSVHISFDCEFVKVGQAYSSTDEYKYIELLDRDVYLRYFYVQPARLTRFIKGQALLAGEQIGITQDIAKYYQSPMQNHVHFECFKIGKVDLDLDTVYDSKKNRTYINPDDYLKGLTQ